MTARTPGVADCECGQRVLYAVPPGGGEPVPVDPDDAGLLVGWQDDGGTARYRPAVPGEQLALGEYFFRLHDPRCPALAPLIPLVARVRPQGRLRRFA